MRESERERKREKERERKRERKRERERERKRKIDLESKRFVLQCLRVVFKSLQFFQIVFKSFFKLMFQFFLSHFTLISLYRLRGGGQLG